MTPHSEEIARLIRLVDERKEIAPLEDGYLYYFPDGQHGALSPWMLRAIADELDLRNAPWDEKIRRYFATHSDTPPQEELPSDF